MSPLTVLGVGLTVTSLMATVVLPPGPLLLWNATSSAPVGLYLVHRPVRLTRGILVAARPWGAWKGWLAERGFLPAGAPLVKAIAATPGQQVCREGLRVSVDGRLVAIARQRDRLGRPLPVWRGCRWLPEDEVLLVNRHPESLDGRYLGAARRADLVGELTPIWVPEG